MRPTFMGFESITRSMMATQKAMDIVGNNLGNIDTIGYTRQRVDMVSMSLSNRYTRFASNNASLAGQGAMVNGVSQIRDPFLDKRFREENASVGYYEQLSAILTDVESALDEIEPAQITEAMNKFEAAWKAMKDGTVDAVASGNIRAAAKSITQVLKQMDTKLNNVWEQQKFDLGINVNTVNGLMKGIADLNATIKNEGSSTSQAGNSYYGPNELLDARNVLLDQLSEYGDMTVKNMPDGTVTVSLGGHTVVEGDKFDTLNGPIQHHTGTTVAVNWQSDGKPINMGGGSLQASLDMINGRGAAYNTDRGEGSEKGILYYKDKIDTYAVTFANTFNNTIQIVDADKNPTGQFKQMFSFDDPLAPSAGGLNISDLWENDPAYIITDIQETGSGEENTTFMDLILSNFTKDLNFGEFTGSFSNYTQFYTTGTLGNQKSFSDKRLEASSDIADSLLNRIFQVSGVSDTEEGVHMMQYQKAFSAMGRLMTALDETLDILINKTGLVGR